MTWILNIYQSFGILKNKQYYAMNKSLFYKESDDVYCTKSFTHFNISSFICSIFNKLVNYFCKIHSIKRRRLVIH